MGRVTFLSLILVSFNSLAGQLPDPIITPGAVDSTATKDIVCVRGYTSGVKADGTKVRDVPDSVKLQAYHNYGIEGNYKGYCDPKVGCEIDHLISLQLGGSNDIKNLWPQSYAGEWNAHIKDGLENTLHAKVCRGEISLQEAQKAISSNWIEAWKKYVNKQ